MRVRYFLTTAALVVLVAVSGLGCRGTRPYPVSGRVVYDDGETASDLVGAAVIFTSDELRVSASGEIDRQGRFTLTMQRRDDGAWPSRYKVVIVPAVDFGVDDPRHKARKSHLPAAYTDPGTTDLSATVEAKANDVTLTLTRTKTGRR
jgi:hypothetical protein